MNIYISWFLHYLQTANHSQLWVVTQKNINYDLLVSLHTPVSRDLLYPHKKWLCVPTKNPPLSLKFAFSLKTSDRSCNLCGRLGKQTSRKLKITLVFMTYQPTPSVSLSVPSCSLGHTERTAHLHHIFLIPWDMHGFITYCAYVQCLKSQRDTEYIGPWKMSLHSMKALRSVKHQT